MTLRCPVRITLLNSSERSRIAVLPPRPQVRGECVTLVQGDARGPDAERLDRLFEQHLAALDGEARGGHRLGDVARSDRAVELSALSSLAQNDHRQALELGGDGSRVLAALQVLRLELPA